VILGFRQEDDQQRLLGDDRPPEWERRRQITLEYASEFLTRHQARRCRFQPVGVAQGWSPSSYADSVEQLQRMSYRRIALGGMVPLKTDEILSALKAIDGVRDHTTQFHLLGVTRVDHIGVFSAYGVSSFDSTSPFRQAFKDKRHNYYLGQGALTAVRVPQVEGNPRLKARIEAGDVDQGVAVKLEDRCLSLLRDYDRDAVSLDDVVEALTEYEFLWDGRRERSAVYRETLAAKAWKRCPCGVCAASGIDVVLFRGSERNKRRGFHNLYVFGQRLVRELASSDLAVSVG
jgi:hypothetical protein